MDMRTHGKGFENCYNQAREKYGIRFVRCRIHSVYGQTGENKGQVIDYVDESTGKWIRSIHDMVVLSVGMEISEKVMRLAVQLDVELTGGGFCKTGSFNPVTTSRNGVFVCGAFQGPNDIPESQLMAMIASA
jgi:heterodisulfide reductase subunit A